RRGFVYSPLLRMWRNWQTRRSQKPVMVTSWRFKSSHPHQLFNKSEEFSIKLNASLLTGSLFLLNISLHKVQPTKNGSAATKSCHGTRGRGVFVLEPKSPKRGGIMSAN